MPSNTHQQLTDFLTDTTSDTVLCQSTNIHNHFLDWPG